MTLVKRNLDLVFKYFNLVYQVVALFALIFMATTCLLQVASRYLSFFKVLGMEELSRMGFVWMVSLAMSLCAAKEAHLRIDVLTNKIHGRAKIVYDIVINLIALIYLVLLFKWSIIKCMKVGHQTTILFLIEMKYLYSALIFGSGGAVLNVLHQIFNSFYALFHRENDSKMEVVK